MKLSAFTAIAFALILPNISFAQNVCVRTGAIRDLIEQKLQKPCNEITAADLATIEEMQIERVPSLRTGDFAGLTGMTKVAISGFYGTFRLPPLLFAGLPSLKDIFVRNVTISADTFADTASVEQLVLFGDVEQLTPAHLEALVSLRHLEIIGCDMTSIDDQTFAHQNQLEYLEISNNQKLAAISANAFVGLSNLT
jgi:hypothetical protein